MTSPGRNPRVTTAPPNVEPIGVRRPEGLLPRLRGGRGRLCLAALAASSACLALSAAAGASAPTPESLVSPQYHARNGDTGARAGPRGPAADPSGGRAVGGAAGTGGAAAGADPRVQARPWYRALNSQYQLRSPVFQRLANTFRSETMTIILPRVQQSSRVVAGKAERNGTLISAPIRLRIDDKNVISGRTQPIPEADARILVQLGLLLGFVYLVFLVCWFWSTRGRQRGVGRVVRF